MRHYTGTLARQDSGRYSHYEQACDKTPRLASVAGQKAALLRHLQSPLFVHRFYKGGTLWQPCVIIILERFNMVA